MSLAGLDRQIDSAVIVIHSGAIVCIVPVVLMAV